MKKLICAAMISVSAFFSACSDDSSSDGATVNSCDINASLFGSPVHACVESSELPNAESECKDNLGEIISVLSGTVRFGSGCASGFKTSCPMTKDDAELNVLIYDEFLAAMPCDQIMAFIFQSN